MRTKIALAAFLVAFLLAANPAAAQTPPITTLDVGGKPSCTAFSMSEDGTAWVTAAHCYTSCPDCEFTIQGTHLARGYMVRGWDVVVFVGPESDGAFVLGLAPAIGDEVHTSGFGGIGAAMTETLLHLYGKVAAFGVQFPRTSSWEQGMTITTTGGLSGLSGSPAFNAAGEVIGLHGGTVTNAPNLGVLVPFDHFAEVVVRAAHRLR